MALGAVWSGKFDGLKDGSIKVWLGDSSTQNKLSINYVNGDQNVTLWGGMEEKYENGPIKSFTYTDATSTTCNIKIHMDSRNFYTGAMNVILPNGEAVSHSFTLERGDKKNCSIL
jgi:hypothetical protein